MSAAVSVETRTCAQCSEAKPLDHFIGRRGGIVTYCAECRTKYYGGAEHVAGDANVGENRVRAGSSRARLGLGARAKTESIRHISKRELVEGRVHLAVLQDEDVDRPKTRGDCAGVPRPCPYVTCKWNLYLEVDETNGSIKYSFPDREPDAMPADFSCALDVADEGGATLEDLGRLANVTRERIRQIEVKGLTHLRAKHRSKVLREYSDVPEGTSPPPYRQSGTGSVWAPKEKGAEREQNDDEDDDALPTRISFFNAPDDSVADVRDVLRTDVIVTDRVWTMFAKDSNARGFDCRSVQSKAATASKTGWRAAPRALPNREETTMNGTTVNGASNALSNDLKLTLTAYTAMKKELGRVPMATELAPKVGIGVNAMRYRLDVLAEHGLAEKAPRGGFRKDGAKPARANAAKNVSTPRRTKNGLEDLRPMAKPPRETSSDPFINDLIAKRDDFRRKADALDVAIEAMSVAL